jgi:hypothetical protein
VPTAETELGANNTIGTGNAGEIDAIAIIGAERANRREATKHGASGVEGSAQRLRANEHCDAGGRGKTLLRFAALYSERLLSL